MRVEGWDVVVAGTGVAGLFCALNLPEGTRTLVICKEDVATCDSMLAQGGMCTLTGPDDREAWIADTLAAGHGDNDRAAVEAMVDGSPAVTEALIALGVAFDRRADSSLDYTREGAHSRPRIVHRADTTGAAVTEALLAAVRALPWVEVREHCPMEDLLVEESPEGRRCVGLLARDGDGPVELRAGTVVLATGGVGGLWERSTNFPCLTGDGIEACRRHGVAVEHLDWVQVHPTSLYSEGPGRAFLISESCRGEGAVLVGADGGRFCDELAPRDVVTAAIRSQMAREGSRYVRLDFSAVGEDVVRGHFSHIYETCLAAGHDILAGPVPVVPAQHYLMGGIACDLWGRTSLDGLLACGETACYGVHGSNRLASNSLLEAMVFAARCAETASGEPPRVAPGAAHPGMRPPAGDAAAAVTTA